MLFNHLKGQLNVWIFFAFQWSALEKKPNVNGQSLAIDRTTLLLNCCSPPCRKNGKFCLWQWHDRNVNKARGKVHLLNNCEGICRWGRYKNIIRFISCYKTNAFLKRILYARNMCYQRRHNSFTCCHLLLHYHDVKVCTYFLPEYTWNISHQVQMWKTLFYYFIEDSRRKLRIFKILKRTAIILQSSRLDVQI